MATVCVLPRSYHKYQSNVLISIRRIASSYFTFYDRLSGSYFALCNQLLIFLAGLLALHGKLIMVLTLSAQLNKALAITFDELWLLPRMLTYFAQVDKALAITFDELWLLRRMIAYIAQQERAFMMAIVITFDKLWLLPRICLPCSMREGDCCVTCVFPEQQSS